MHPYYSLEKGSNNAPSSKSIEEEAIAKKMVPPIINMESKEKEVRGDKEKEVQP